MIVWACFSINLSKTGVALRQFHAFISGKVQGVSFRYTTAQTATQLNIVGWVRNLPDGRVEVLAEGEVVALEQLLTFLHVGPTYAHVDEVEVTWAKAEHQFRHFSIVR